MGLAPIGQEDKITKQVARSGNLARERNGITDLTGSFMGAQVMLTMVHQMSPRQAENPNSGSSFNGGRLPGGFADGEFGNPVQVLSSTRLERDQNRFVCPSKAEIGAFVP
jgi:hypothetical protein